MSLSLRSRPTTSRLAHRVRRTAVGAGFALLLAAPLTACGDDGFALPAGDQLKQFVSDAQSQLDTIGSDIGELAAQVGKLPDSVRATTQDALDKSRDAAARGQSALDDAKNAREGAEKALQDAGSNLESAQKSVSDALDQLKDKTDSESVAARSKFEELRKQLDKLEERVG